MLIQSIIAGALDLAGGDLIRQKLDSNFAVLAVLNVIDTMMLELSNSQKQIRGHKLTLTLAANADTGTIDASALNLDAKFVRFRENANDIWQVIDVVDEIEDLTRAANSKRRAILFQGSGATKTYFLSWTPDRAVSAELWGKAIAEEITDLNGLPPFPPEFSLLAAYRAAEFALNQLLLVDAKNYSAFVLAQKMSIKAERDRCEYVWRVYRALPSDAASASRVRPFTVGGEPDSLDEFLDDGLQEPNAPPEWNSVEW